MRVNLLFQHFQFFYLLLFEALADSLFFFEPGNAKDLAGTISDVFLQPQKALEVAERGQQVYLSHSWEHEREILVKLVCEILAGPHRPPLAVSTSAL